MKKLLTRYWPIIVLTLFVVVISILNYVPGTILTGWDNLHPEYNFLTNIKRSLFSVWQEYQSLGLLGGHAHSTDILRQISLYLLSILIPTELLRYLSTYFMLFAGTLGAYFFVRFLIRENFAQKNPNVAAFLGALFYLLNLATVQTFYAPFESFIAHFAALPWLLYTSVAYVLAPSRKTTWMLLLSLIFALPMAYIPTLFVVYLISLAIILLVLFINQKSKTTLRRYFTLGLYIFLMNAFWLLPFLYFTITNSDVTLHSKINQMSTETIFLQNKEFGTITEVPLLKGFWFNNTDPDREGIFQFMLQPWRNHLQNPVITIIGYGLFLGVLSGAYISLRRKQPLLTAIAVLLLFCFTALAIATPPFSYLNELVRNSIPILNQAFRFPFTKFSILTALVYASLFAIAMQSLLLLIRTKKTHSNGNAIQTIFVSIITLIFIAFSWPVYQGNLFYEKERIPLPKEYKELFSFFTARDHTERIANFHQHTFWGWSFYSWGYGGSGFLWYGIPQPMLDRAFDVWSETSENYYYEISQAVYRKDPEAFQQVLDKYAVTWVMIDRNIIYPPSPKALFYDDLDTLIQQIPSLQKEKQIGNIALYRFNRPVQPEKSVALTGPLNTVNDYTWTSDDNSYRQLGLYGSDNASPTHHYPFRSLTTLKSDKEHDVSISHTDTHTLLKSTVPARKTTTYLHVPSYANNERIVPVRIKSREDGQRLIVEAEVLSPAVTIGTKSYGGQTETIALFSIQKPSTSTRGASFPYTLNINGTTTVTITDQPNDSFVTTFLSLSDTNTIVLTPKSGSSRSLRVEPEEVRELSLLREKIIPVPPGPEEAFSVKIPKINDNFLSFRITPDNFSRVNNCDGFRNGTVDMQITGNDSIRRLQLSSNNATACTFYYAETLPHDVGYVISLQGENSAGRPLHFWVENVDQRRGPIDTYLPETKNTYAVSYLLSPMESFGRSYSFHFDNIAIGAEKPVNTINLMTLSPFPYSFAKSLVITKDRAFTPTIPEIQKPADVSHPNESLYIVSPQPKAATLILYQSYDQGWKAYQVAENKNQSAKWYEIAFPFIFGREIKEHIKINNWANGWITDNSPPSALRSSQIVIVYLPQYLQYIGALLLLLTLVTVSLRSLKKRRLT